MFRSGPMGLLRKLSRYPAGERRLLLRGFLLTVLVRIWLVVFPFDRLRRLIASTKPRLERSTFSLTSIGHAVQAAGRRVPGARCLERSLVAQHLLLRAGYPAELKLGVAKDENGSLHAHAWVECDGEVVFDTDRSSAEFLPLSNSSQ